MSSVASGTPDGLQFPATFQVVPVDVLVTPNASLPANSKKLKISRIGEK